MLILFVACLGPDRFAERYAEVYCTKVPECDPRGYQMLWTDEDDCHADVGDSVRRASECLSTHCTFDDAGARDCIGALNHATCDELGRGDVAEDCGAVWVDCDGGEGDCFE